MGFASLINGAWKRNDSLLCVGLDPDPDRFPESLRERPNRIFEFCKTIIDATAAHVCAFKPQIAYFASQAAEEQLAATVSYIHINYPGVAVILDAKRGDIGSTAEHYAREAFERYNADAVTVSPYMGLDSLLPYLSYRERGVIVLCRTSNGGGADLQNLSVNGGESLYLHVARLVAEQWDSDGQCALVVGATVPKELARVRQIVGDKMAILVPGIGEQGGSVAEGIRAGQTSVGAGLILSSSRAVLYASSGEDFGEAAGRVASETRKLINSARLRP